MTGTRENQNESPDLTPEDRRIVERLRAELDPGERSPGQRAAFARRLEERLESPQKPSRRPLAFALSVAAVAAAAWLWLPAATPVVDRAVEPRPLLAYTFYETDYLGASEEETFLSAEYEAIATAFDVQ